MDCTGRLRYIYSSNMEGAPGTMSDLASATCSILRAIAPAPQNTASSSISVPTIPQLPLPSRPSAHTRSTKRRAHHKSPRLSFAPVIPNPPTLIRAAADPAPPASEHLAGPRRCGEGQVKRCLLIGGCAPPARSVENNRARQARGPDPAVLLARAPLRDRGWGSRGGCAVMI